MKKLLVALAVGASFFFAQPAVSDILRTGHPTEYVVVKGDTLWDISARFLEKPWLWPQIWKKNPQVKNPHWIYPGDIIRLTYIDGKPYLTVNEASNTNQAPTGAIDLNFYNKPFLKDLRIVTEFTSLPYVLGAEEGHLIGATDKAIYVKGLAGVAIGQEVEIFRPTVHFARSYQGSNQRTAYSHLNSRGDRYFVDGESFWNGTFTSPDSKDYIGTELMRVGTGRVTQLAGTVASIMVTDANREILKGDRVTPSANSTYDAQYFPTAGPDIGVDNRVMAIRDGMIGGSRGIIAIPIGSKQGVSNGSTYSVWGQGELIADTIENSNAMAAQMDKIEMPDQYVGDIMVFRTFDNVSYAIVMKSIRPIHVGDYLKNPSLK